MKKLFFVKQLWLFLLAGFLLIACEKEDDGAQREDSSSSDSVGTIVEVAQDTEALSSLVAAVLKADELDDSDLVGTLNGEGPFTVFAPTNDAFTALLGSLEGFDSLEDFDTDEEKELLVKILTYHVVAGVAAESGDLSDGQTIGTVQGEEVTISLEGGVFVQDATEDDAEVIIPDVEASNGVVHVINKVLIPQEVLDALNGEEEEEEGTLVDLVVETETLSILEAAVIKAGLVDTLNSEGPFTVFAPTDDAFVALLEILGEDYNSLDDFDSEEEMALLKDVLLYHVIPAEVFAADLAPGSVGTAFAGNDLEIIASGESFVIGDATEVNANITGTDFAASNGVAHTIDKVL
ncbi:MAG: fasciclin domain-containing protein, partial [Flavobacteriaceae bacterium]